MPNWAIISRSGSVSAAAAVDTPNCMALVLAAALLFELPSSYRHIFYHFTPTLTPYSFVIFSHGGQTDSSLNLPSVQWDLRARKQDQ